MMEKTSITLTVFFDGQFWVGIFEKIVKQKLSVSRFVFGSEPKDSDVLLFELKNFSKLKFSPFVELEKTVKTRENPKVIQRKIKQSLSVVGVGTKSQQAMKLQIEQRKIDVKLAKKEKTIADKTAKFELRQLKKNEKHKGH